MLKVGLTGGIGSGKTTVLSLFSSLGVPTISADVVSRELLKPGTPTLAAVKQTFGAEMVRDGVLDRIALRKLVFESDAARRRLEDLLHPLIFNAMRAWIADQINFAYCVLEIPLLIESRQTDFVDRIVVVDCPVPVQKARIAQRDHMDTSLVEQILLAQLARSERLKYADHTIDTNGDFTLVASQVAELDRLFRGTASKFQ